jgi:NSS family neurotransmitter:Na+ symporter
MRKGAWSTRWGIYLAAIGSAFGLGCLWRFPLIVVENGGGAFFLLFLFIFVLIGLPLLIGELLIGKLTRRSVFGAQKQLNAQNRDNAEKLKFGTRWLTPMSVICVLSCILILSYYSVICGWVMYFLGQFLVLPFTGGTVGSDYTDIQENLAQLRSSGFLQFSLAFLHIALLMVILAKEVDDGIEKWVGFIIPIFIGILTVLISQSLSMESDSEIWRYFFYPDVSKLKLSSLGAAVGHVCFTLSIGFGTMITFGSYLKDKASVYSTGFRVAVMDSIAAVVSAIFIFPLVASSLRANAGPDLLFQTVPSHLLKFSGGQAYGIFFFICLYLAALGASISLFETIVANIREIFRIPRSKANWMTGIIVMIFSIAPALSSNIFIDFKWNGKGLLQTIDYVLIDWIIPLLALGFCTVVVYFINDQWKREEFSLGLENQTEMYLYSHWKFLLKWAVPVVILTGLVLQIVDIFI